MPRRSAVGHCRRHDESRVQDAGRRPQQQQDKLHPVAKRHDARSRRQHRRHLRRTKAHFKLVNDAIENQTFVLLFQPIISLRGDSDEHYEVFLRLVDEKETPARAGSVPATRDPKRRCRQNRPMGDSAVDQSLVGASLQGSQHPIDDESDHNSLIDEEFIQWLSVAIKAARLPSDAVIFQIAEPDAPNTFARRASSSRTESDALPNVAASLRRPPRIRSRRCKHVPVDFVKIDGKHVQELDGNPRRKRSSPA